ncbi:MAG: hypothetical protein D3908_03360, partial [Candidatus Electrothrix sp. AUS4]|nr:hypothetical protein [Candidatus Electrothrix sp. AUS4]
GQKLLLVIDQFEEIITLCQEEEKREDFINELMQALKDHNEALRIVLTLRSDFEAQISQNYLKEWWQEDKRFVVPPMTQDELREVIEQPASVMVLYFEPRELADRLINEVIQTPGALPLLSFTLSEMYLRYVERQSDNRALTEDDYKAVGGVIGSLRQRIDQEYDHLDADHQDTMKRIMLRMVAFEGGELTRRRVSDSEFVYPDVNENERVKKVIDILSQKRLLIEGSSENPEGIPEPYVEPAHDALIVAWDKLLKWRAEEAEAMLLQRQLTRAAADWKGNSGKKEKKGLLWDSNPKLLRTQEILREKSSIGATTSKKSGLFRGLKQFWRVLFPSYKDLDLHIWLNQVETDFVRRSVERKRNWTRGVTASIMLIFLALTTAWWITNDARIEAQAARDVADEEREKAVEQERKARHQLAMNHWNNGFNERDSKSGSTLKALHYLAKAEEEFSSLQKDEQLAPNARLARKFIQHNVTLDKTIQYSKGKNSVLSQNRRRILFWNSSGFQVADTSTGEKIADIDIKGRFHGMAFSHDGAFALAWSFGSRGNLWLYDTTNGKEYELGNNKTDRIRLARFSEDGIAALVIYHGNNDSVFLIDVNKKTLIPHEFIHNGIRDAVFSKNNSKVLTWGRDGNIRIFNSKSGKMLTVIKAHEGGVDGAIFYETENKVMSWSESNLILRDIATGKILFNFEQKDILGATSDKNGERILIWTKEGIAYILDNRGNELFSINCNSSIHKAEFNADESRILTWCGNGTAQVWDSRNGKALSPELKHGNSIALAGFNHDESRLITSDEDGTMRIWKNNSNNSVFPLMLRKENGSLYDGWVNSAVFSPDGSKVLTASSNDLTARIWSSETGKQLTVMNEHNKGVDGAAFNTDGSQVLTWSQDATARVWDSATGKRSVPPLIHDDDVRVATFSNDGAKILTWIKGGTDRLP